MFHRSYLFGRCSAHTAGQQGEMGQMMSFPVFSVPFVTRRHTAVTDHHHHCPVRRGITHLLLQYLYVRIFPQ